MDTCKCSKVYNLNRKKKLYNFFFLVFCFLYFFLVFCFLYFFGFLFSLFFLFFLFSLFLFGFFVFFIFIWFFMDSSIPIHGHPRFVVCMRPVASFSRVWFFGFSLPKRTLVAGRRTPSPGVHQRLRGPLFPLWFWQFPNRRIFFPRPRTSL